MLYFALRAAADEGAPGGGGGDEGTPGTEDLAKQLRDAQASIAKLEAKNTEIVGKNKKLNEIATPWMDFEPTQAERLKQMLADAEKAEDEKHKSEGNIEAVLERNTARVRGEYEPKLEAATQTITSMSQELSQLKQSVAFDKQAQKWNIDPELRDYFDASMQNVVRWHRDVDSEPERLVVMVEDHPMDFDKWIESVWTSSPAAKKLMLAPPLAGGSGAQGSASNGVSMVTADRVAKMGQREFEAWRKGAR